MRRGRRSRVEALHPRCSSISASPTIWAEAPASEPVFGRAFENLFLTAYRRLSVLPRWGGHRAEQPAAAALAQAQAQPPAAPRPGAEVCRHPGLARKQTALPPPTKPPESARFAGPWIRSPPWERPRSTRQNAVRPNWTRRSWPRQDRKFGSERSEPKAAQSAGREPGSPCRGCLNRSREIEKGQICRICGMG